MISAVPGKLKMADIDKFEEVPLRITRLTFSLGTIPNIEKKVFGYRLPGILSQISLSRAVSFLQIH